MLQTRRHFLFVLVALTVFPLMPITAMADKGSRGGGSDDSGDDDSDNDDSGSDDSKGDDSGGDSGGDDNDDRDNKGDDNKGKDDDKDDNEVNHDDARDAVKSGRVMSLRNAMKRAKDRSDGRIIDVNLIRKSSKYIYVFTIVEPSGRIGKLKMDAASGRFAGLFGF
jgi:uncharacterized membrane protein YkoI